MLDMHIDKQKKLKIQIFDWIDYEKSLIKGMVLLRSICLETNTDICLVVYDEEYKPIWITIMEIFSFEVKNDKYIDIDIDTFLSVYEYAAYTENCLVMLDARIFFETLIKLKHANNVNVNDAINFYKDYDFTIFNTYTNVNKTTRDLIVLY